MRSSSRTAFLFLLPSIGFVALFLVFPIVESFRLSLYRQILTLPWLGQKAVGVENYTDLLTDPVARDSFRATFVFIAVTIPLAIACGRMYVRYLEDQRDELVWSVVATYLLVCVSAFFVRAFTRRSI